MQHSVLIPSAFDYSSLLSSVRTSLLMFRCCLATTSKILGTCRMGFVSDAYSFLYHFFFTDLIYIHLGGGALFGHSLQPTRKIIFTRDIGVNYRIYSLNLISLNELC